MRKTLGILAVALLLAACGGLHKKKAATQQTAENQQANSNAPAQNTDWQNSLAAIARIESFDGTRTLEKGQGFFVEKNLLVTRYSLVNQASNVKVKPLNETHSYRATKFVAFDRINDLIILQVDSIERTPIPLVETSVPKSAKSMLLAPQQGKTIQLFTGKVLNYTNVKGNNLYRITNRVRPSQFGAPVFVSNKKAIGVAYSGTVDYQPQSFAIPSNYIVKMLKNRKAVPEKLETLKITANAKIAAENAKIKGLVLETDMGNITIKLFNETPAYRDNFIRLAKEHYFDSLLIHRVIADFGIQSGAADTRYAKPGASVGWKGPGYTIPAHIVPKLYHKRGMIGSPRKPDRANQRRRSDGSQFYIVSGRKYLDEELDDIEKQNNHTFTKAQRETYKTLGGAPHLDGTYTVFGQVVAGMDVVDEIVQVETDQRWRPVKDIRIKRVRLLK